MNRPSILRCWPVLVAAACSSVCLAQPSPAGAPAATDQQVTRETAWIEKRLLSDACFAPLLQSRTPAALSDVLKGQVYMVTLPAPPEQHDGIDHTVIVRRADRMAWLHRSGGIAGMAQTVGPVPLAGCLADAPPTAAAR